MQVQITPYGQRELERVSVVSIASLRRAYPNYFLHTQRFLETVTEAINGSRSTGALSPSMPCDPDWESRSSSSMRRELFANWPTS